MSFTPAKKRLRGLEMAGTIASEIELLQKKVLKQQLRTTLAIE
jgi:hypothetical protein